MMGWEDFLNQIAASYENAKAKRSSPAPPGSFGDIILTVTDFMTKAPVVIPDPAPNTLGAFIKAWEENSGKKS